MISDNKYAEGKIYKITNDIDSDIYVGSTCKKLHERLYKHISDSRSNPNCCKLYPKINRLGTEHFHIHLIEYFPCMYRKELRQREQEFIERLKPSLNTIRSYSEDKEIKMEQIRKWYEKYEIKMREWYTKLLKKEKKKEKNISD